MKQDKRNITSALVRPLTLIVNTGSDSHKYALYEGDREVVRVHLEKSDGGFLANVVVGGGNKKQDEITEEEYDKPFTFLLGLLKKGNAMASADEIGVIGCRIVAPGEYFWNNSLVDDKYVAKLREIKEQAPLHIAPILAEIEEIKRMLPDIKIVGVSDSEFHKNLPSVAKFYPLPKKDRENFGILRYGYHGISMASVVFKIEKWLGAVPKKIVVCHLGSGSSITAIKNGKSVDTSMGFTPLEGPPMGSRIGNIDAAAALQLGQSKGLDFSTLENYFNTKCGLLGLSGKTKDVRELIELEKGGDEGARLALDSFAYGVKKYIGAYMAVLGGLDLLVFTATIGERSNIMRERICSGLDGLGIVLDKTKNNTTISADGYISADNSPIKIAVVTTDEMGEIMRRM